jgi:hypothetical protein
MYIPLSLSAGYNRVECGAAAMAVQGAGLERARESEAAAVPQRQVCEPWET